MDYLKNTKITTSHYYGLATITGLIFCLCLLYSINCQRIAWGVRLAGLKPDERKLGPAQEILQARWNEFAGQAITLSGQNEQWSVRLIDLGFQIDAEATVRRAYEPGHGNSWLTNLKEQVAAVFGLYDIQPNCSVDQDRFNEMIDQVSAELERPTENASLFFNENTGAFLLKHSTEGIYIDRDKLLAALLENAVQMSDQPVNLRMVIVSPKVENNEVEQARQTAQRLIDNSPYFLTLADEVWSVTQTTLLDWLAFQTAPEDDGNQVLKVILKEKEMRQYLARINWSINHSPVNALMQMEDGQVTTFAAPQTGYIINMEATVARLVNHLLQNPPIKATAIVAEAASPEITLQYANELGINTLLGSGESSFAGSSANRTHNIETASDKLNYLILSPGEEFSFNNALGMISAAGGYLPEQIIKKGQLVLEYGGGVCQVSTTVFRAAINAGLEILERAAHAFPVAYYSPQGFDATVYSPATDLRFLNDTPDHLLMEFIVKDAALIINFYGTEDGRVVEVTGPEVLWAEEDGSMQTVLVQSIYKNGELVREERFYSTYQSPNAFVIGE